MKKTFILFNPNTLDFDQVTTSASLDKFILDIKSPDPNDVDRAKDLLKELTERLSCSNLSNSELTTQLSLIRKVILYPLLYEIQDIFQTYIERRDFYLNLQENDLLLWYTLSNNKYRRANIEGVLDYSKIFTRENEARALLAQAEGLYDKDKLTGFQVAPYEEKSLLTKIITRLAFSVAEELLLKDKVLIIN